MSAVLSRAVRRTAAIGAVAAIAASALIAAPAQAVTYSISGTIAVPDGVPGWWLGATLVCVEDPDGDYWNCVGVNAATGAYSVTVPGAGDYGVTVYPGANGSELESEKDYPNLIVERWPGVYFADEAEWLSVSGPRTGINFALETGRTVAGTVALSDAGLDEHSWVQTISERDGQRWFTFPDPDGTYLQVGLPPGEYYHRFVWDPVDDVKTTYTSYYWQDAFRREEAELLDLSESDLTGIDGTLDKIPFFGDALSNVFYPEIMWLASTGITTGWVNSHGISVFKPTLNVNRDVMAAFLYRFAGSPEYDAPEVSPFIDVPTTHVFYKQIAWLAETGVTRGWTTSTGTEFRPSTTVKRDVMAAFLYRFSHVVA